MRKLVVVLVLVFLGVAVFVGRRRAAAQTPQMHYETAPVDRGTVVYTVTASGTVSALVTVQVGAQVSGRVQEILVDYNSPVKANQVIARLDPLLLQAAVDQARANFLTAQSTLKTNAAQAKNATLQLERSKRLLAQQLLAPSDFDTTQANAEVANAQMDAAKSSLEVATAALHQAEVNLGYATITSPIDGTVISRNVDVGQTVAAAFQAPVLFLIAKDLRQMQVDTSVAEADVGRLTTGMRSTFTVDAYPGEPFVGRVRQIRSSPTTVQNVVTYDAVIDVDNSALKLKPGMTANTSFVVAHRDNVVRVPNAAIRFQPDQKLFQQLGMTLSPPASETPLAKDVWVLRNDRPVLEHLKIGISDGTETEVVSGNVHAGERLVVDMTAPPGRRFGIF